MYPCDCLCDSFRISLQCLFKEKVGFADQAEQFCMCAFSEYLVEFETNLHIGYPDSPASVFFFGVRQISKVDHKR